MSLKDKRHIWLPATLAIYFVAMAYVFGREMIASGNVMRFCFIAAAEVLVLVALVFALRKKNRLRVDRKKLHSETDRLIADSEKGSDDTANP